MYKRQEFAIEHKKKLQKSGDLTRENVEQKLQAFGIHNEVLDIASKPEGISTFGNHFDHLVEKVAAKEKKIVTKILEAATKMYEQP